MCHFCIFWSQKMGSYSEIMLVTKIFGKNPIFTRQIWLVTKLVTKMINFCHLRTVSDFSFFSYFSLHKIKKKNKEKNVVTKWQKFRPKSTYEKISENHQISDKILISETLYKNPLFLSFLSPAFFSHTSHSRALFDPKIVMWVTILKIFVIFVTQSGLKIFCYKKWNFKSPHS